MHNCNCRATLPHVSSYARQAHLPAPQELDRMIGRLSCHADPAQASLQAHFAVSQEALPHAHVLQQLQADNAAAPRMPDATHSEGPRPPTNNPVAFAFNPPKQQVGTHLTSQLACSDDEADDGCGAGLDSAALQLCSSPSSSGSGSVDLAGLLHITHLDCRHPR